MPQVESTVTQALIDCYYYLNQYPSSAPGEPKYWEMRRQQVMTQCLRAFQEHHIDYQQQDPEDR